MKNAAIEDVYELSPVQQGILYHVLYAPKSGVYLEQLVWTLSGKVDVSLFERAWQSVIARHPVLRTSFHWEDLEKPFQVVQPEAQVRVTQYDWRGIKDDEREERLNAWLGADRRKGFDLSKAPIIRLALIQTAEESFEFVWTFHHILMDGWSYGLVIGEMVAFYDIFSRAENPQLPEPSHFSTYIKWRRKQDLSRASGFWRKYLNGVTAPTSLGVGSAPGERSDDEESYGQIQLRLSPEDTGLLQSFARQNRLTLNTVVQGAWALLLGAYSGDPDIIFGAAVSGRPAQLSGVENIVGLFLNTLPVRVAIVPEQGVAEWLKALQNHQAEAREFEFASLTDIQGWTEIPRGSALFDSIVVFENVVVVGSKHSRESALGIQNFRYFGSTNYPLTVIAMPGTEFSVKLIYDRSRFEGDVIGRMIRHFVNVLQMIVRRPALRLSEVELPTEAEKRELLLEWNDTNRRPPSDRCVHELFEEQVRQSGSAAAVVYDRSSLTYEELNTRANRLAHYLRLKGAGPETVVGLCVERGLEMAVGMLGILKAGAAYLPMDTEYPQERLEFMMANAKAAILLTQEQLLPKVVLPHAKSVCLDRDWPEIEECPCENPGSAVRLDNLLYVIYTSGSTGRPKGIGLSHGALKNLIEWHLTALPRRKNTLQFASLSFDASFHEFFAAWCSGGTAFIASEALRVDIAELGPFLAAANIEKAILPVVVLQQLSEGYLNEKQPWDSLREVITTGEQLQITVPIREMFRACPHIQLHNHYGPSETHVVTSFVFDGSPDLWAGYPPIGRPIANTSLYLLDRNLNPVPVGVTGELYIGGESLARGYLGRPDLTAEKFTPDPFCRYAGARLYKTGDLSRYLPGGNIEFLGRRDHQAKIRGFRVELGEVETALGQYPLLREAAVMVREDTPGNKRLVAYLVSRQQEPLSVTALREFLGQKLPEYMIPARFVVLDALPLTSNGKVNRRALPAPDDSRPEMDRAFVAPRTPLEEAIAGIWREILKVGKVGVNDSFFELGGHSLSAMQLVSRIKSRFRVEVSLRQFFMNPAIAHLAALIEQALMDEIEDLLEGDARRLAQA